MKKPALMLVFMLTLSLIFSACGGGGGGGTGGATKSSVTISGSAVGTVGISGLVGTSKAALIKKSASNGQAIGSAKVVIESYHGGKLDKTYQTVTDGNLGTFSTQLELWSDGGYIVVSIEKDGLVKYSKTFTYSKPDDLKELNLKAELAPYLVKVVSFNNISSTDFFKASAEDDAFSIAIVENSNGQKKIVTDNEVKAAKASGAVVKWQMDLSKSMLKAASDDISDSITIKAQNYDATNEEDMKNFPAPDDNNGNKLVSTGFDFIDIKTGTGKTFCITKDGKYGTLDETGNCVVSVASSTKQSSVKKSAIVSFKVKRQIDDCKIADKDEDTNKAGKQVGFYIYRGGKWVKIGNATLYGNDAFSSTYDKLDDTKVFTGTCDTSNRPYAVFTDEELKKASEDLGFDLTWHNFDYVAMGELKTFCIEGEFKKVKKQEKSPLSGLYLYLQDLANNNVTVTGFRAIYAYTDENGKFRAEGVTTAIDADYDVTLSFSDPFSGKWISNKKKLKAKVASGCYQLDLEEVTDPFECSVTGKLTKSDGSAFANKYIYTYLKNKWYGYKSTYSDKDGLYKLPAICGEDYILTDGVDTFDFNVNGNTGDDETDDTGKQVVLNAQFPNHNPYAYAYANQYSIKTGETVQLYGYGWDADGDTLTYSWSVTPNAGTFSSTSIQMPKWTAPTTPGKYTLTLKTNDGNLDSNNATISIDVYAGNRPPKISYLYVPYSIVEGDTVYLYASTYDADGDTLTYSWSVTPNAGTFSSTSAQYPQWTAPNTAGTYTITLSVSDGTQTATESRNIIVYANNPPVILSYNIPSIVTPGTTHSISAYAYDPEGNVVTYSWSLNGGTPTGSSSSYCSWKAPATEGTVTVDLTVNDGKNTATLAQQTITVKKQNNAPKIDTYTVPASGGINTAITLTASASDPDNDTLTYSWYVDGNLIGEGSSKSYTPRIRKTYTIKLVVSDGALTAERSSTFTVTNTAPTIANVLVPPTATAGTAVELRAYATDADGDTLTYTWYAGTAQIGTGASFNWTPTTGGSYSITVKVYDGTDTVVSSEQSITVNTRPVVNTITADPASPQSGQQVTLTATATDADNDTLTYTWYLNTAQIGTGASITWTPSLAGTYTIEVRVTDGKVAAPVTKTITITVTGAVTNQPPTVSAINVTAGAGNYTLTATASDPNNAPLPLSYTWYINGVQYGTGQTLLWAPTENGTYTLKVVVSDGSASAELSQTYKVTGNTSIFIQ